MTASSGPGLTGRFHSRFALLVLAAGILGLIDDAWPMPFFRHPGNLHWLFGVLLWACVVAGFYERLRRSPCLQPADIRAISRHLSRLVYLLLYILMFFSLVFGVLHRASFGPAEDFQIYLVYGCAALLTIHALAALCRHFVIRGTSAPVAMRRKQLGGHGLNETGG